MRLFPNRVGASMTIISSTEWRENRNMNEYSIWNKSKNQIFEKTLASLEEDNEGVALSF